MERKNIMFPAIVSGIATKVDGSIKVALETRELPSASSQTLFDFRNKEIFVLFSANNDITERDIPETKPDAGIKNKTPAQRLRNTLFVLWDQRGRVGDFDSYYTRIVSDMVEQLKGQTTVKIPNYRITITLQEWDKADFQWETLEKVQTETSNYDYRSEFEEEISEQVSEVLRIVRWENE